MYEYRQAAESIVPRGWVGVPVPDRGCRRQKGRPGNDAGADDHEPPVPPAGSENGGQTVHHALLPGRGGSKPGHGRDGYGRYHGVRWVEVRSRRK